MSRRSAAQRSCSPKIFRTLLGAARGALLYLAILVEVMSRSGDCA